MHEKINIIFMHVFLKDFWREKKGVNEQDTNKIIQNNELKKMNEKNYLYFLFKAYMVFPWLLNYFVMHLKICLSLFFN